MNRKNLFVAIVLASFLSALAEVKPPFSLLWRFSTTFLQRSNAQVVVDEDTVYFPAGNSLYALDINTGEQKWRFNLPAGVSTRSTPVLYKGDIYVAGTDGNIYVLNKQGEQIRLLNVQAGGSIAGAPIVAGNLMVFSCLDNYLYALDPEASDASKMLKWKFRTNDDIPNSPAFGHGYLFAQSSDVRLYALTPEGKPKWAVPLPSSLITSSPLVDDKYVYAVAGSTIQVINPRSGGVVRSYSFPDIITQTPLLVGDTLYVGCKDGKLYIVEAKTGKPKAGYSVFNAQSVVTTTPVLVGDYICFGTEKGLLVAIDKQGKLRWQYRVVSPLAQQLSALYPPQQWSAFYPWGQQFGIYSAPVWTKDRLFVISDDGTLHCFTAQPLDVSPPMVSDLFPQGGPISGLPVPLTISAVITDEGSGVDSLSITLRVDGKVVPPRAYKFDPANGKFQCDYSPATSPDIPIPNGEHTITLRVVDWYGNETVKEWKFTVDNSLPPGAGRGTTPTIYYLR